ncbi:uncharacterized protein J4E87_002106 [Alternaria ethzedia]|uniref:uncharacterized protein n=1 Tax=Alternaria ethzedia TaxID=181014 RepID=UPI0020C42B4A|nr:uncharacterized protein J4E87_002106 [Alternaria ethzedia]KAI4632632.1 hypothetical protein J4E87_002106 [Alternaria ethzedia]
MPSLLVHSLFARQNPLDEAKNTLSSWDNCMAKAYCNGSGGRGHKRVKSDLAAPYPTPYGAPPPPMNPYNQNPYAQAHAAAPPPPPIDTRPVNQQYRSNAMPTFAPAAQSERPQFATFDSTRAVVNEDSLPAMPTWKDGRDVHVQVEEQPMPQKQGDMEMDRLDRNGSPIGGSMAGVAAAAVPTQRRSPGPGRSPVSPMDNYGQGYPQSGYQNDSFVSEGAPLNGQGAYGRPYAQQDDYRRGSPGHTLSPVYSANDGYAPQQPQQQQQPYGRRSPGAPQAYDSHDQLSQYNQQPPYNQQPSYNQPQTYDQRDYYDEPDHRHQSPSPPAANPYAYNNDSTPSYDTYTPPPAPAALQPGYAASESTNHGSFTNAAPAYPGQRSYTPVAGSVGQQQQPYRAFTPGTEQQQQQSQQQYTGVSRKPVEGSFREI